MQDKEKRIYLLDFINRNKNLGASEKNILFKLHLLDNSEKGCYGKDDYLSGLHNLTVTSYNKILKKLEDKGFIQRSNVYTEHGKHRMIKVNKEKILNDSKIENDNTTYQNGQVHIVENDNTAYQNGQVHIVENDNAYTKDKTKENTKESDSPLAFDFLKNEYSKRFKDEFQNKYHKSIFEKEKFIDYFNNKVIIEIENGDLKWNEKSLFSRLLNCAKSWVKFQKEEDRPTRKLKIFHGNNKGQ